MSRMDYFKAMSPCLLNPVNSGTIGKEDYVSKQNLQMT